MQAPKRYRFYGFDPEMKFVFFLAENHIDNHQRTKENSTMGKLHFKQFNRVTVPEKERQRFEVTPAK